MNTEYTKIFRRPKSFLDAAYCVTQSDKIMSIKDVKSGSFTPQKKVVLDDFFDGLYIPYHY